MCVELKPDDVVMTNGNKRRLEEGREQGFRRLAWASREGSPAGHVAERP